MGYLEGVLATSPLPALVCGTDAGLPAGDTLSKLRTAVVSAAFRWTGGRDRRLNASPWLV